MAFGARDYGKTIPADVADFKAPTPGGPRLREAQPTEKRPGTRAADKSRMRDLINEDKRIAAENKRREEAAKKAEEAARAKAAEEEAAAAAKREERNANLKAKTEQALASAKKRIEEIKTSAIGTIQGDSLTGASIDAWDTLEKTIDSSRKRKKETAEIDPAVALQRELDQIDNKLAQMLQDEIDQMSWYVVNKRKKAEQKLLVDNNEYGDLSVRRDRVADKLAALKNPPTAEATPAPRTNQAAEKAAFDAEFDEPKKPETVVVAPEPVVAKPKKVEAVNEPTFFADQPSLDEMHAQKTASKQETPTPHSEKPTPIRLESRLLTKAEKKQIESDPVIHPEDTKQERLIKLLKRLKDVYGIEMDEQGKRGFFAQRKFDKLWKQQEPHFVELFEKISDAIVDVANADYNRQAAQYAKTGDEKDKPYRSVSAPAAQARYGGRYDDIAHTGDTSGGLGMRERK